MHWSTLGRRGALAAAVAAVSIFATMAPSAAEQRHEETTDWGTVIEEGGCVQAHAWIARVKGAFNLIDTALFASHYPETPSAPEEAGGGKDLVNLILPGVGVGLGRVGALYTSAMGNKLPAGPGRPPKDAPCSAYAEAGGGEFDVGIPYVAPLPGAETPMSPVGLHGEGITVTARTSPKGPVKFTGRFGRATLSSFGFKVIDVPLDWPPNFGVRIPSNNSLPVIAQVTLNEQVTTDETGTPTEHYNPKAKSGYVNAGHASLLGSNVGDVTIGHAAVLYDAAQDQGSVVTPTLPPVTPTLPPTPTDEATPY